MGSSVGEAMNEIACHRSGLSVHTRDDGKCVIVEWCDFHKQYQTAKERRHIESGTSSHRRADIIVAGDPGASLPTRSLAATP